MRCASRERLEELFSAAIARFDDAMERLLERVATCSRAERLALNNAIDRAVDLMDQARAALDWHIRQHSCFGLDGVTAEKQPHSSSA